MLEYSKKDFNAIWVNIFRKDQRSLTYIWTCWWYMLPAWHHIWFQTISDVNLENYWPFITKEINIATRSLLVTILHLDKQRRKTSLIIWYTGPRTFWSLFYLHICSFVHSFIVKKMYHCSRLGSWDCSWTHCPSLSGF